MLYCGIDIGTTNTKAVVLNSDLELLDKLTIPVGSVGGGDQLPAETWFEHFCGALEYFKSKNLFHDSDVTCSISAQGGSFVLLDKNYHPISPG